MVVNSLLQVSITVLLPMCEADEIQEESGSPGADYLLIYIYLLHIPSHLITSRAPEESG